MNSNNLLNLAKKYLKRVAKTEEELSDIGMYLPSPKYKEPSLWREDTAKIIRSIYEQKVSSFVKYKVVLTVKETSFNEKLLGTKEEFEIQNENVDEEFSRLRTNNLLNRKLNQLKIAGANKITVEIKRLMLDSFSKEV